VNRPSPSGVYGFRLGARVHAAAVAGGSDATLFIGLVSMMRFRSGCNDEQKTGNYCPKRHRSLGDNSLTLPLRTWRLAASFVLAATARCCKKHRAFLLL